MNTEIYTTNDIAALIKERSEILSWLKDAKEREMNIRKTLVSHFFPVLQEGTNSVEKDGYAVKVVHTISRKIDEATLDSVMENMPPEYQQLGKLIGYKPVLVLDTYRQLDDENRKFFEQALVISEDGAPQLKEIVDIGIGGDIAAALGRDPSKWPQATPPERMGAGESADEYRIDPDKAKAERAEKAAAMARQAVSKKKSSVTKPKTKNKKK